MQFDRQHARGDGLVGGFLVLDLRRPALEVAARFEIAARLKSERGEGNLVIVIRM